MFDSLRENFELILIALFLISTVAYAIYRATFAKDIKSALVSATDGLVSMDKKSRKSARHNIITQQLNNPLRKFIYFFADLFWVLLFVVVVRSFLYEPFIIPSGSMKPGLLVGDIVLVNKNELGVRMPVTNTRLTEGTAVQRGDVLVFKYPKNPEISYIKRVIGIPGDKIYYDNRRMTINGKDVSYDKQYEETDMVTVQTPQGPRQQKRTYTVYEENLNGYPHTMRYSRYPANFPAREWIVPEGQYFVMGDNRDNSADGRDFGLLDDKYLIGKANRIVFNFDCLKGDGKCDRFFKKIQ